MKTTVLVLALLVFAACGNDDSNLTETNGSANAQVTFCSCANEPARTGEKAKACAALMESVPQQEAITRLMACREQLEMPDDGPDLCFCFLTMSQDPQVRKACDDLLPENPSRSEIKEMTLACSR
ncbi:MAG: hypothetical protein HKN77_07735 [Woeseiaceae bacterium]|nr:hypothetical protein [Woeseiaceae bacterium]